jgi:hypothetical protein
MPIRRCAICGQENPEQLKKCIEQKEKKLAEFREKGGQPRGNHQGFRQKYGNRRETIEAKINKWLNRS